MTNGIRLWLITGYADVRKALSDPGLAKDWQIMRILRERDIQAHQGILARRSVTTCSIPTRPSTSGCGRW